MDIVNGQKTGFFLDQRDNLVIHGIEETHGETDNFCLQKVYNFLESNLEIADAKSMKIVRCHRLGPKRTVPQQSRPIIFKLHWFGDRQTIWAARRKLKGTKFILSENFPAEIERRRKILTPVMYEARRQNKERRSYLVVDKLHIGNRVYTVDTLSELPASLDPRKVATPSDNNVTAFFTSASPLSNFYKTDIKGSDGTVYTSCEQMYQHMKAINYKDNETAARILASKTPLEAFKLGKTVKGMTANDWYTEGKAKKTMYDCVWAKFHQSDFLKDFLVSTGSTQIAEGNPRDGLWGVALRVTDKNIYNHQQWKGKNWMGDILEAVRDTLKNQ